MENIFLDEDYKKNKKPTVTKQSIVVLESGSLRKALQSTQNLSTGCDSLEIPIFVKMAVSRICLYFFYYEKFQSQKFKRIIMNPQITSPRFKYKHLAKIASFFPLIKYF